MAEATQTVKQKAGSVNLDQVVLIKAGTPNVEFDLNSYIVELSIFEDIFSNALSGSLVISDSNNLIGSVPIIGGEILNISVSVPGYPNYSIHRSFYVYSIKDRANTSGDRQQMYILYFISLEAMVDNITFISKKYAGDGDDIAKEIFSEYLAMPRYWNKDWKFPAGLSKDNSFTIPDWKKEITTKNLSPLITKKDSDGVVTKMIESGEKIAKTAAKIAVDVATGGVTNALGINPFSGAKKITFVVPMWTPFKAINWLANRHLDEGSISPTTLFWETTQGFYFTSIDSIFKAQSERGLRKLFFYGLDDAAIKVIMDNKAKTGKNTQNGLPADYTKVESVLIPKSTDILQSQDNGHYSSNLVTLDIVTKKYQENIFDYASNFSTFEHLHGKKNAPQPTFATQQLRNFYSYKTFRPTHTKLFNDYEVPKHEDTVLQRTSILYDISNIKIEISVPGFCTTQAGEVVEFYYPKIGTKPEKLELKNLVDPYLSGSYLVTAVRHIILRDKYYMRLELAKESFATGLG